MVDYMQTMNLIFAGVGGQGVLLIAEMTALAAVRAGYDVKQTEVHGVSQRGGSVESHVRFGPEVHSPLVMPGQADVVVGLEKLEGLRYANFLRPSPPTPLPSGTAGAPTGERGILLVNDHEIIPASVANAAERYPHHALDFLQQKGLRVMALPASQCARDLGDGRMANVIMLGALSALLALPEDVWKETLQERVPARHRESNLRAFEIGKELASPAPNPLPLATELPVGRGRGQGGE
jgi:indolepyruvate ferredoxin oxidoreductase beta subunit